MMSGSMNLKLTHIQFKTTPFTLKESGEKDKSEAMQVMQVLKQKLKNHFGYNSKDKKKKTTVRYEECNVTFQNRNYHQISIILLITTQCKMLKFTFIHI